MSRKRAKPYCTGTPCHRHRIRVTLSADGVRIRGNRHAQVACAAQEDGVAEHHPAGDRAAARFARHRSDRVELLRAHPVRARRDVAAFLVSAQPPEGHPSGSDELRDGARETGVQLGLGCCLAEVIRDPEQRLERLLLRLFRLSEEPGVVQCQGR